MVCTVGGICGITAVPCVPNPVRSVVYVGNQKQALVTCNSGSLNLNHEEVQLWSAMMEPSCKDCVATTVQCEYSDITTRTLLSLVPVFIGIGNILVLHICWVLNFQGHGCGSCFCTFRPLVLYDVDMDSGATGANSISVEFSKLPRRDAQVLPPVCASVTASCSLLVERCTAC